MATKKESSSEPTPDPSTAGAGITIKGSPMTGKKTETRLFQTAPDTKEWLTKDQATEKGFYWAD